MQARPVVSVIIIFLNGEKYLEEAIESVFAQSYDGWELLLVDDGSTDASATIARRWAARRPDVVRYLHHPGRENRGMSASRNLGLQAACGEYVAFLDADDVWLPNKLEAQLAIMAAQPRAAMVYGRSQIWLSWTGKPEDRSRDHFLDLGVPPDTLVEPPKLFFLLLENRVQTPTTCSVLIRRRVFDEIGGFVDAFHGMFEDQVFFAKLCLSQPVFVSGTCWARYRQHDESYSATADRSGRRLPLLRWLEEYLAEQQVRDPLVWKALRRELWPYEHPFLDGLSVRTQHLAKRLIRRYKRTLHP